jgi:type II secretory pathway component PulF
MMDALGPLNLVNLLALGSLLYLALTIMDSRRGGLGGSGGAASDTDPIRTALGVITGLLLVAGAIGFVSAIAGPIAVPLAVLAFVFGGLAIRQYYRTERHAVLPFLAIATERRLPLATAARAYALERHDYFGRKSRQLAELLEGGARLPVALRLSGHHFGIGSVLAVGVGDDFACLDSTLRHSLRDEQRLRQVLRNIGERMGYLSWVASMLLGFSGYFSIWFLPTLQKIGDDFGIPRSPSLAKLSVSLPFGGSMNIGGYLWDLGIVPGLVFVAVVGGCALFMMGERWWRWVPLAGRLSLPHDCSWVLRAMGWSVKHGRTVPDTLASVSRHLPSGTLQRRVQRAADAVQAGGRWTAALKQERILTEADGVLLSAAEEAGNLAWALEHLAESRLRQLEYRWQRAVSFAFPVVIAVAALDVFSLAAPVLQFLSDLVDSLA